MDVWGIAQMFEDFFKKIIFYGLKYNHVLVFGGGENLG
jgi:hypothetical protein